jgi:hypothetical protein
MNKKKGAVTAAVHTHEGNTHVVSLSALRVMLLEDTNGWFAQGLEIDYAASGASLDEVKKNFEDGFCATMHEHLTMYGNIERFLTVANKAAWDEFYHPPKNAVQQTFSCVQFHDLEAAKPFEGVQLPFDRLAFISRDSSAANSFSRELAYAEPA